LRNKARDLIVKELKMSGAVTEVVRKETKAEIRAEWKRSGRDVALLQNVSKRGCFPFKLASLKSPEGAIW
jgi:hypothetical protein